MRDHSSQIPVPLERLSWPPQPTKNLLQLLSSAPHLWPVLWMLIALSFITYMLSLLLEAQNLCVYVCVCVCVHLISCWALHTGEMPLNEKDSFYFVLKTAYIHSLPSLILGVEWGRLVGLPTSWYMRWTEAIEKEWIIAVGIATNIKHTEGAKLWMRSTIIFPKWVSSLLEEIYAI